MKFSANLGFLWTEMPLPEAVRAAAAAGFDAVEFHFPYSTPLAQIRAALAETGLPVVGLNTIRGDHAAGENGLAALPGRGEDARTAVDEALDYGAAIGAGAVHVMAGKASGAEAHAAFLDILRYATARAAGQGMNILIEPLNRHDAPDYFLRTTDQALAILQEVGADNLGIMFDCYHVQRTEGDVSTRLAALWPHVGHVQIASAPDRGAPDHGELDFEHIFGVLRDLGHDRPVGAEYSPRGPTGDSLAWLKRARARNLDKVSG